jgi:hypothetical protein
MNDVSSHLQRNLLPGDANRVGVQRRDKRQERKKRRYEKQCYDKGKPEFGTATASHIS